MLAIALAAAPQSPVPADEAARSDAQLTRIRAKLATPGRLRISTADRQLPEPTFRIEIHQHPYFTEVPFIWTFAGGGMPLTAPGLEHMGGSQLPRSFGGGTDVLPLFTSLKRALDERAAKADVQK
ncbi:MAG TPA: hypothetical protein VGY57_07555, partial [Vicinamibacterales bacterium]|nr:hypothetical protein [Vicinamibacterales bacterium]